MAAYLEIFFFSCYYCKLAEWVVAIASKVVLLMMMMMMMMSMIMIMTERVNLGKRPDSECEARDST